MLPYKNKIAVAGHRGYAAKYPENTIVSFKAAIDAGVDMIETDVHMTKDGRLVLIHDATVDRTTDGTGLVMEKTLAEIKALDAGAHKGEDFRGERIPTLEELLDLVSDNEELLFNIELKDFYEPLLRPWQKDHSESSLRAFSKECADKTVSVLKKYGVFDRCVINSWGGELLEYVIEEYPDAKIHAYSPQEHMGRWQKRCNLDYSYCVCLWGIPEKKTVPKKIFDVTIASGVEPWIYFKEEDLAEYDEAISYGAKLITANDPVTVLNYLREKGLHK